MSGMNAKLAGSFIAADRGYTAIFILVHPCLKAGLIETAVDKARSSAARGVRVLEPVRNASQRRLCRNAWDAQCLDFLLGEKLLEPVLDHRCRSGEGLVKARVTALLNGLDLSGQ